jgi:hypothetical protein
MAAGAVGRGPMRASHADREQVIDVLKDAFAQGRLDKDELDARAGQAFASRTYAELAAVTADLPAGPAAAGPASTKPAGTKPASAEPGHVGLRRTPAQTLAIAASRAVLCILIAFAVVGVAALTKTEFWVAMAFFSGVAAMVAASGFLGYGVIDAWQARRSRGQLPPRPGLQVQRRAGTSNDPGWPGADQTQADLRTHSSRPDRPRSSGRGAGARRGLHPVPGAA